MLRWWQPHWDVFQPFCWFLYGVCVTTRKSTKTLLRPIGSPEWRASKQELQDFINNQQSITNLLITKTKTKATFMCFIMVSLEEDICLIGMIIPTFLLMLWKMVGLDLLLLTTRATCHLLQRDQPQPF